MRWMGWTHPELMAAPARLVQEIIAMIGEEHDELKRIQEG